MWSSHASYISYSTTGTSQHNIVTPPRALPLQDEGDYRNESHHYRLPPSLPPTNIPPPSIFKRTKATVVRFPKAANYSPSRCTGDGSHVVDLWSPRGGCGREGRGFKKKRGGREKAVVNENRKLWEAELEMTSVVRGRWETHNRLHGYTTAHMLSVSDHTVSQEHNRVLWVNGASTKQLLCVQMQVDGMNSALWESTEPLSDTVSSTRHTSAKLPFIFKNQEITVSVNISQFMLNVFYWIVLKISSRVKQNVHEKQKSAPESGLVTENCA